MSFYDVLQKYEQNTVLERIQSVSKREVEVVLSKESFSIDDYFVLISPAASGFLEEMARKAHRITLQHFGRVMVLYAPLYLANYCVNSCLYCGFNVHNGLDRRKLTMEELKIEAKAISQMGIRHILILTGESRKHSSVDYIMECVRVISEYFTSVSIEVYPLEEEEYMLLVNSGVDGLTIYQEVYDEGVYKIMHPSGPKKDYRYRLDTPERGCRSGMRSVGIGALMGLANWRAEAFYTVLHAHYLTSKYPEVEISISIPRMRPHTGNFQVPSPVSDRDFVQILLAARLFLKHVGITVSTRERSSFRDNLIGLGVTRMSAGSVTEVGGYNEKRGDGQFEISDDRSVEDIRQMLYSKGFQPVFKDWQFI